MEVRQERLRGSLVRLFFRSPEYGYASRESHGSGRTGEVALSDAPPVASYQGNRFVDIDLTGPWPGGIAVCAVRPGRFTIGVDAVRHLGEETGTVELRLRTTRAVGYRLPGISKRYLSCPSRLDACMGDFVDSVSPEEYFGAGASPPSRPAPQVAGPPWQETIMPADWPELHGMSLGVGGGNNHKWVERHGVVVIDERWQTQSAKFMIFREPLPGRFRGWSDLRGSPRVQVQSTRPRTGEPIALVDGLTIEIGGRRTPYETVQSATLPNGHGEASWTILFDAFEMRTIVIGYDIPDIVTSWRQVRTEPLVAAREEFFRRD